MNLVAYFIKFDRYNEFLPSSDDFQEDEILYEGASGSAEVIAFSIPLVISFTNWVMMRF